MRWEFAFAFLQFQLRGIMQINSLIACFLLHRRCIVHQSENTNCQFESICAFCAYVRVVKWNCIVGDASNKRLLLFYECSNNFCQAFKVNNMTK